MSTNFEPLEWESFVKSTKIGTHENKAIHSITNLQNQVPRIEIMPGISDHDIVFYQVQHHTVKSY